MAAPSGDNTVGFGERSLLELAMAAPVLVGVVLVGAGFGMALTGGRLKQPMTRYLQTRLNP